MKKIKSLFIYNLKKDKGSYLSFGVVILITAIMLNLALVLVFQVDKAYDKKFEDLSATDVEFVINEDEEGIFKKFADALTGLKPGDKTSVKVDGSEVNELSASKTKYDGQTVSFKLKLVTVSELERESYRQVGC